MLVNFLIIYFKYNINKEWNNMCSICFVLKWFLNNVVLGIGVLRVGVCFFIMNVKLYFKGKLFLIESYYL